MPHYFPVLLQPRNCAITVSNYPDVDINLFKASTPEDYQHNLQQILASPNQTQYKVMQRETGITKPSLFSGLSTITPIPRLFLGDCMHQDGLNLPELLLGLWRGTLESRTGDDKSTWDWAVLTGKVWEDHGKEVTSCKKYILVSLESYASWNPAEKISSGYKALEYMVYLYGLGPRLLYGILPELLYGILPDIYWHHYCKVVYKICTIHRPVIHQESLAHALQLLLKFVLEFETLYYQHDMARFHFVQQCDHALIYIIPEVLHVSSPACITQWTMEHMIGILTREICQPSNPFANLSHCAVIYTQINALKAMIPDLELEKSCRMDH